MEKIMEKSLKGIIFDLDGVIVFTDRFHYEAWKKMSDEMEIYFDETINNRLRGVSRMESLSIILEKYHGKELSLEEKKELADQKNKYYRKLLKTMTPEDVSQEVRKTLGELRKRGYKLAIGSSSQNAKMILKQVDLIDAFDEISDGNNIVNSKPDPEVFLKAAQYLGLEPEECAVVEDAYAGIDAAKAGKMIAIAVGDATSYSKSDIRLQKFEELLDYFH